MLLILTVPAMAVIVVMNEVSLAQHYVPVAYLFDVCVLCVCVCVYRQELWWCCVEVGISTNRVGTADVDFVQGRHCFTSAFQMLGSVLEIASSLYYYGRPME